MFKLIRRIYYNHLDKQEYKRYIKPKEKKPDIDTKQGLSNATIYIAVTVLLLSILLACIFIFGKKDGNKNKKVVSAKSTSEQTTKEVITESEISSVEESTEMTTQEVVTEELSTEAIETEAATEEPTEETTKKKRKKKRKKRKKKKQKEQTTQQESKQIIPLGNYNESNILNADIVKMIKNSVKANISGRVDSELRELAEYMSSRKITNAITTYNQLTNDTRTINTTYIKVNIESDDDVSVMGAIEEIISKLPGVNGSYGLSISSFRGNTVGYEIVVILLQ
ncbi:hypothetical protein [Eubacterium sp.]|uniref:hypothetical protein n=1 Tax=Eubacterium sp. TaxID=142586 RepID=UPI0025D296AF|nr:hypothetical protein [Eubacterium sp.]MCR5628989.1 hypothetical protein [Eubacterium sp.]